MTISPADRLRRLATALPALGEDGEWMVAALQHYLTHAQTGVTLEEALGLAVAPGGSPWWAEEARARRDGAIRTLAHLLVPGASTLRAADTVSAALRRYGASAWRHDRALAKMPSGYIGTSKQFLFTAFRAGDGKVPLGPSRIREILATDCNTADSSAGEIPRFHRQRSERRCDPDKEDGTHERARAQT